MGCHDLLLDPQWDYRQIRDYDWFTSFFEAQYAAAEKSQAIEHWLWHKLSEYGQRIFNKLSIPMTELSPAASALFKIASVPSLPWMERHV